MGRREESTDMTEADGFQFSNHKSEGEPSWARSCTNRRYVYMCVYWICRLNQNTMSSCHTLSSPVFSITSGTESCDTASGSHSYRTWCLSPCSLATSLLSRLVITCAKKTEHLMWHFLLTVMTAGKPGILTARNSFLDALATGSLWSCHWLTLSVRFVYHLPFFFFHQYGLYGFNSKVITE